MRRSPLAFRIVALAFASGAIVLAGCPAASDQPATDPVAQTVEVETETVDIAEVDQPTADPAGPSSTASRDQDTTETDPPNIGPGTSREETAPAVTIERPNDFLRPTLPDASLRNEEEPADPPETVTDRSAEAVDPNYLPGGTPIDDLFEGLDDKPNEESKN